MLSKLVGFFVVVGLVLVFVFCLFSVCFFFFFTLGYFTEDAIKISCLQKREGYYYTVLRRLLIQWLKAQFCEGS